MAAKLARERATDNLVENLLPQVNFAETVSPGILCFICKEILKNPMQLSCGHRVCKLCIENSIPLVNGERFCPEDEELIERTFPDRSALTDIMNLTCFCLALHDGCDWKGLLLDLEEHVKKCEYFVQVPCPYHDFQCEYKGSQVALEEHLMDDLTKHEALLATCLKEVLEGTIENRVLLNETKEKTKDIERVFATTSTGFRDLEMKLKDTGDLLESRELYTQRLKEQYTVFEDLVQESYEKRNKLEEFHTKFKDLITKVDNQMQFINESEKGEKTSGGKDKKCLTDKIKRLEQSNKTNEKQIQDFSIKTRVFQCSSNDGNYTWKLDNLVNRFKEAKSGKVSELYTPPIYTSSFGYKFSAKVMLDGEKDKVANNSVNHIAFYIVIMQGDFDEILQFPFPYPITITLMNTSNKDNISRTLYPDPNKVHFQKPYKNMNPAIGFARFASHQELQNGGFIKDNCIYFRLKVERTGINVKEPNI